MVTGRMPGPAQRAGFPVVDEEEGIVMSSNLQGLSRRRRATATGLAALALTLPLGTWSATAAPMNHYTFPASELGSIQCGTHTYTFFSGNATIITKSTDLSDVPAATLTLSDARVHDEAARPNTYRVVGTETYSDAKGLLVAKFMILGLRGGQVDNLNIVAKNYESGGHGFSFGTCGFDA